MFSKLKFYTLILVLFFGQWAMAQPPEGEEDPDPVAARIDVYLLLLLLIGIVFAYTFFKRDFNKKR